MGLPAAARFRIIVRMTPGGGIGLIVFEAALEGTQERRLFKARAAV
jgi:hypothetical protein